MKSMMLNFLCGLFAAVVLLTGCLQTPSLQHEFDHEINGPSTPWTHDRFDNSEGKFTFAIFSDLNGGERERVFEVAIEQLSLLRPELILSVGDLIDGATQNPERLAEEWDRFDSRASRATAPVFRVGGNHDLTSQTLRDVWIERYGARYYHFVYKNVLFLVLDTEDHTDERMQEVFEARQAAVKMMEEDPAAAREMEYFRMPERITGEIGPEQSAYFLDVIERNADVRWTMLFMHKPVWQRDDEPDFLAIERALSVRPYTLFNGHFHTYSHRTRNGRDYIMLGTTGGSQSADNAMSFDHVMLVTVGEGDPSIVNLRLDGILDKTGVVAASGDTLCFQVSGSTC